MSHAQLLRTLLLSFFVVTLGVNTTIAQTNEQPEQSQDQDPQPAQPSLQGEDRTAPATSEPTAAPPGPTSEELASSLPPGLRETVANDLRAIRGYDVILRQIGAGLAREGLSDGELNDLRGKLDAPRDDLPGIITRLRTLITEIETRLNQLGPPPEEGAPPETETVAMQRRNLSDGQVIVSGAQGQARVLLVEADQIASRISERRRDRFTATLAERTQSVVDPALWRNAAPLFMPAFQRLSLLFQESARATANRLASARETASGTALFQFGFLFGTLVASIALLVWGHRYLRDEVTSRVGLEQPEDRLTRLTVAVWSLVVQGFLPLVAMAIVLATMAWLDIFPSRFETLMGGLAVGAGLFFLVRALSAAILRPSVPALRLVSTSDTRATTVNGLAIMLGTVIGINAALNTAFDVVAAQLDLEVARSAAFALLVVLLLFALLRATRGPEPDTTPDAISQATSTGQPADSATKTSPDGTMPDPTLSSGLVSWLRLVLWLILAIIIVTALGGYIALSSYIAGQVIYAGGVLATLYLLLWLADEISNTILVANSEIGQRLAQAAGIKRSAMDQLVVIGGGIVRLVMIVVAIILVLMPWGFETREWVAWIRRAFFGFQIGEITISLSSILSALVLFAIGYAITRAIQRWLDNRFLPRTELDVGIKTSIRTGLGYLGIVAAATFAVSFVGLDLANLAIVAGALSVGIGFGLQSVVNNFVSGLILLAERPIKIGDWIEAGGEQGYVRRINVRSTEVQTFDRASVIIPNSDLIAGVVKNMMHTGKLGRIKVNVGVSYDTDVNQARDLILECARNHPQVLGYPEPKVYFLDFGASSLDLTLFAFLGDVDNSLSVASDLRYAILARFREAGVEIPFPQRDLNVRGAVKFESFGEDPVALEQPSTTTPARQAGRKTRRKPQGET